MNASPKHDYSYYGDEYEEYLGGYREYNLPARRNSLKRGYGRNSGREIEPRRHTAVARPSAKPGEELKRRGLFSTFALIFALFGVFAFMIYRYQAIFSAELEINDLKSQIEELTVSNEKLSSQIAVSENIVKIQDVASNELKMGFPEKGQMVKIKLTPVPPAQSTAEPEAGAETGEADKTE